MFRHNSADRTKPSIEVYKDLFEMECMVAIDTTNEQKNYLHPADIETAI